MASGAGSTYKSLLSAESTNKLNAKIIGLIVDRECGALAIAHEAHQAAFCIDYKKNKENFAEELLNCVRELNPDFILLCGFLRKIPPPLISAYRGKIFNSHPSLLPKFGGHGLYGRHVHEAVKQAKETETGVTFHVVTENYDEGPIIAQKKIQIAPDETVESIENRVKALEKEFLIEQINALNRFL